MSFLLLRVVAPLLAVSLLLPARADAHGLVQRANLPIPEYLFVYAAVAVLIVSFVALEVLWQQPRLERTGWRPLPGGLGRVLASRPVEWLAGLTGVALLVVTLVAAFFGSPAPGGTSPRRSSSSSSGWGSRSPAC